MNEWPRVVVVLVPWLLCCANTYTHANIPDSRLTNAAAACFNACLADAETGDVSCVVACPGAESGDGPCRTKSTIASEDWHTREDGSRFKTIEVTHEVNGTCVDEIEHHLSSRGKVVVITAIVVAAVAFVTGIALVVNDCSKPGHCQLFP